MNNKICKIPWKAIFFHLFVVGWMLAIFHFSAQPGEESSDLSGGVSYWLAQQVSRIFHLDWKEVKLLEVAEMIHYPIRKLAHMTEYGILAVLTFGAAETYQSLRQGKRRYLTAVLVTFLYAVSDELHQLFVPGRDGRFTDVLVDTTGAVIGLVVMNGVTGLVKNSRNRKNKKDRKRKR